MERIILRVAVNAIALWAAAGIVSGITLEESFWRVLLVAAIFGVVNAFIKPLLVILSIPFIVVTLGLALVVINAAMLGITDWLTTAIEVDGFWSAVLGAVVISIVSWAVGLLLPEDRHSRS